MFINILKYFELLFSHKQNIYWERNLEKKYTNIKTEDTGWWRSDGRRNGFDFLLFFFLNKKK